MNKKHISLAMSVALMGLASQAWAIGGASGSKLDYQIQGNIGQVVLNPYKIAPLTAVIRNGGYELHDVRVEVQPKKDGQVISYNVSDGMVLTYGGVPVFGLYADYVNTVKVSYTRVHQGKSEKFSDTYTIYTPPAYNRVSGDQFLRSALPKATVTTPASDKRVENRLYYINNMDEKDGIGTRVVWNNPVGGALEWSFTPQNEVIDTKGEIRWFLDPVSIYDLNSIDHAGTMMGFQQNEDGAITWGFGQRYVKYDIMGRQIFDRQLPDAYNDYSHSMDAAQNGNYLLRVASSNYKRADGKNVRTVRDVIVEVNPEGRVIDEWKLMDILDPTRSDILKALDQGAVCLNIDAKLAGQTLDADAIENLKKAEKFGDIVGTEAGRNWAHVNSVDYDPSDDSIIISSRHQSAIIKIGRDKKVKWILGAPRGWKGDLKGKLLTPVDANGKPLDCGDAACRNTDFDWTWTQHTAFRVDEMSKKGKIVVSAFDNGDARSIEQPPLPEMKYSRAVFYEIDEKKMTVKQIWEYGKDRGHEWFSPVTSIVKYDGKTDSVLTYSASAGATFDVTTGAFVSMPNPVLTEFDWKTKKKLIEFKMHDTTGYQAFVFDVNKAFNPTK